MVGTIEGVGTMYIAMTHVRKACETRTASTMMTTHLKTTDQNERLGPRASSTPSPSSGSSGMLHPHRVRRRDHRSSPSGRTMDSSGKHHIQSSPGWTDRITA